MEEKFDIKDTEYLENKVKEAYARNLAFKYMIKTRHILKSYSKEDKIDILKIFSYYLDEFINIIYQEDYKFTINDIERLITVISEILFQKIILLHKAGIDKSIWSRPLELINITVYNVEFGYIESDNKFYETYKITSRIINKCFKDEMQEILKDNLITLKQYKTTLDKSCTIFLKDIISRLVSIDLKLAKKQHLKRALTFIILFVILNCILYLLENKQLQMEILSKFLGN